MNDIVFAGKRAIRSEKSDHFWKTTEIIFSPDGGKILTQSGEFCYGAGDAVVVPPTVKYRLEKPSQEDIHIAVERALLPARICKVSVGRIPLLKEACRQAAEYFSGETEKKETVLSALGELIVALITAYSAGNDYSPAVKSVIADIEKNVSSPSYSLENFMRGLPLNYDYIRKLFKKEVGVTPHEYLVRARMTLAKKLLQSGMENQYSDFTISQISEMCGYSEPLYFSRVFKKYYGIAPSRAARGDG